MINNENDPLVSIIMTSYNRQDLIGKAIRSSLEQDYTNLEIIISDNDSTDNTDEVIKKNIHDKRIRYSRNSSNIGMLANFKKATEQLANGTLITYVSSDDYLINKSFVSEAVAKFKEYKSLVTFSGVSKNYYFNTGIEEHNSSYTYKKERDFFNKLISGKVVFNAFQYAHILNFGGTVFYKKDIVELDVFREPNTTYADLQAILLLSLKGDFYFSDTVSYIQTFHDQNSSGSSPDSMKALLNLSFAGIPFREAIKKQFLPEQELNEWYYQILKPFIIHSSINFLTKDKKEYQNFISNFSKKNPQILKRLEKDKKWKLLTLIYGNKFLRNLYSKFNTIKGAGK